MLEYALTAAVVMVATFAVLHATGAEMRALLIHVRDTLASVAGT